MERRVLLAIFLSFLVLYAYQAFFLKPPPKPVPKTSTTGTETTSAESPAVTSSSVVPSTTSDSPATTGGPGLGLPKADVVVGETAEREVVAETSDVIATFTNRGGRLKSWRLKKYRDAKGAPLELIPTELADRFPLPLSLRVGNEAVTATLNTALYSVRGAPDGRSAQETLLNLTFEYRDKSGLRALKEIQLEPSSYLLTLRATVTEADQPLPVAVQWGPALGERDLSTSRSAVKPGGLFSAQGKETRLTARNVESQPVYEQDFYYAGVEDHYFMTAAFKPGPAKVTYQAVSIPPPAGSKDPPWELVSYTIENVKGDQVTFYVGPKDFDTLVAIDRNFVRAINFGMFSVIVVPLLRSLNWIHGFVGNYGWSIVLLTVIINLVLFPLNHKSVVSMRKMQEIQPEAKAIQERYAKLKATDPARQKMNQELMALYRERGVNPASGCVPILLTLPVFLAFYALLTTAIELRGAPFTAWIHDLSQPDPYYVMPAMVGLSQIWLQWMTPQTGVDPTQQKMMMIMPLVLIFVFVSTPAGALIYWLVGNVWRVVQQQVTNYMIGPPNIRQVRPPAERRVKRAGAGKTEAAGKPDIAGKMGAPPTSEAERESS